MARRIEFPKPQEREIAFGELEAQACHRLVGGEGSKAFSMSFCAAI